MSKYTTEVRYICEKESGLNGSVGYNTVDKVIKDAIPGIFSFDFPIFDESYREVICTKILRHYYTREIGFETVGLWKLKLQTKLCEIMPFYNQLYESELIKFNPLYDVDLKTTHVGDKSSELNKEENKSGIESGSREVNANGSVNKTNSNVENNNITGANDNENYSNDVESGKIDKNASGIENEINSENRSVTNSANERKDGSKIDSNKYGESESGSKSDTRESNSANTNAQNNKHYDLYSDTPQGALTGVDTETFLTNARKITDMADSANSGKVDESGSEYHSNSKSGDGNSSSVNSEETEKNETNNENVEKGGFKNKENSETENSENSRVSNEKGRNEYEENASKSAVGNEDIVNNSATTDNSNRTNLENMTGLDKFNSTESYVLHVIGKQAGASYSKMLKEFRDTFLNIDMDVIKSLSDLFMNIW